MGFESANSDGHQAQQGFRDGVWVVGIHAEQNEPGYFEHSPFESLFHWVG
jgi:hypothetical protein